VTSGADFAATDKFTFVRDGFHFWAFVLGPIFLAWHRLWLALRWQAAGAAESKAAFASARRALEALPRPELDADRVDELLAVLDFREAEGMTGPGEDGKALAQAARELEMSYMRAWSLVRTMNEAFREPLVVTHRGGQGRGGASLTPTGERALLLYRKMQQRALRATATELAALEKLLRYR